MLSQLLADYAEANNEGKQDMYEEAAERMVTAEKAIKSLLETLDVVRQNNARLQAVEQAARRVLSDIKDNWHIEKLQPGDVAETDISVDCILALAAALDAKP